MSSELASEILEIVDDDDIKTQGKLRRIRDVIVDELEGDDVEDDSEDEDEEDGYGD